MRLVFGLVLVAGLGLAGVAVYMAQNYISAYENALQKERAKTTASVPTQRVYVTTRSIAYGETIAEADIKLAPWPVEILPEGHFTEEALVMGPAIKPRVALRQMEKFEALVAVKVSEPGGSAGLTSHLKPGESALAIKVDVATGVSGLLRPGNRVNVYWTGRPPSNDGGRAPSEVTKLIETGVRVIAIDQMSDIDSTSDAIPRTITVAGSEKQIRFLTQAQNTGELTLSLMAVNDDTVVEAGEVDQMALLGLQHAELQQEPEKPETCFRVVRRGVERFETPAPCPK